RDGGSRGGAWLRRRRHRAGARGRGGGAVQHRYAVGQDHRAGSGRATRASAAQPQRHQERSGLGDHLVASRQRGPRDTRHVPQPEPQLMTQQKKPTTGATSAKQQEDTSRAQRARAEHEARELEAAKDSGKGIAEALPTDTWLRLSQVSLVGLFIIAFLGAAYVAQPLVVPVVLAWTIATIVLPAVRWMQDRGLPRALAVVIVALALIALIVTLD